MRLIVLPLWSGWVCSVSSWWVGGAGIVLQVTVGCVTVEWVGVPGFTFSFPLCMFMCRWCVLGLRWQCCSSSLLPHCCGSAQHKIATQVCCILCEDQYLYYSSIQCRVHHSLIIPSFLIHYLEEFHWLMETQTRTVLVCRAWTVRWLEVEPMSV